MHYQKCRYYLFMAVFMMAVIIFGAPAKAQTNPISDMTGQEIIQNLQSGSISPSDVAANINLPDATPINIAEEAISNIANLPDVSIDNLGGLIDSLGADDLIPRDIGLIRDLANDFSIGDISAEFQNNIIENIGLGNITPRVAQFTNLVADTTEAIDSISGIIDSLESFEGFDLSSLDSVLQDALGEGIGRIEGVAGLVTENLEAFQGTIDEMISQAIDPAMFNGFVENIANGIIPPDLMDTIQDALPNLDALTDIIDPAQFLEDLGITEALENFTGDAQELLESVAGVAQIQNIVQGLEGIDLDGVLDALPTEALDKLLDEFGNLDAIKDALDGILGDNVKPMGDQCEAQCSDCSECPKRITANHERIRAHVTAEFVNHRNWIIGQYFTENIRPALAIMTSQLTTMGIQQVQIIGSFFDAKHQLETQRLFQTMAAQAHKDYHPSEGLCVIGTNSRSLASSTRKAEISQKALSDRMMNRQLASGETLASRGGAVDRKSRLEKFITTYCNPFDHAGGLVELCKLNTGANRARTNADINFTKTLGGKLTVDLNPLEVGTTNPNEEDIYALSSNLFANEILPTIPATLLTDRSGAPNANVNYLLDIRAIAAKRSVAQNSFAAITGLKSEGDGEAGPFLKAILKEVGVDQNDIEERLGKNPSYHAQMEMLTKDIYQQPTFYTNLYDKPVNIERKSAALLALELMQDRDIYDSLLRSEAVLATLIEVSLEAEQERISNELTPVNPFDIDSRGPQ